MQLTPLKDKEKGIIPGIGGMVYPKLGLGDMHEKNKYNTKSCQRTYDVIWIYFIAYHIF